MTKLNGDDIGAEYSKLKKKIGSASFNKLKQPAGSYFLASLDFDYFEKVNKPSNWNFHICAGNDDNHDHYLLSKAQAEKLYEVLGRFLKEYEEQFKPKKK